MFAFRHTTPAPVRVPDNEAMWGRHDTYAEVTCGAIKAEALRFAYWDDRDGWTEPELSFEVRINGSMPGDSGVSEQLYATESRHLLNMAAVCGVAAMLLDEARQTYATAVSA